MECLVWTTVLKLDERLSTLSQRVQADGQTEEPNELADKQIGRRERGAVEAENNAI